jgi:phenylacetate-coenzyme A ligase PaaK-like adenylate-forming protein
VRPCKPSSSIRTARSCGSGHGRERCPGGHAAGEHGRDEGPLDEHRRTERIQSSPSAIERSVYPVIGKEYRSSQVSTIELRFNAMKRDPGGLAALLWDAWRAERGGPGAVAERQARRLADLVRFARARSPFYGERYRHLPTHGVRLDQLPPVTKPELMRDLGAWVTDPAITPASLGAFLGDPSLLGQRYLGRYLAIRTSGVTNVRAILLHDAPAVACYRGLTLLRGFLPRLRGGAWRHNLRRGNRVAAAVIGGGHFGGATIFEAARQDHRWPFDRIRVLSVARPLADLVRELNEYRPAQLVGYPSALLVLAGEQQAGRLRIDPAVVATGGDWLGPEARERIRTAFGCPVRQNYGASEFPPLAWDCAHGALHVGADWAILEPVDRNYRPVPPGQASASVLLTNLANRVQPIIRYDLGDTVTLGVAPCACGSSLPTVSVHGRRDDIVVLRTPAGRSVSLLPNALLRLAGETPGVEASQVVQHGPDRLGVRLETCPGGDEAEIWARVAARLRAYLATEGLTHVALERLPGAPRPDPSSGKLRRVVVELDGVEP